MNQIDLAGRIAVITGGAQGIGYAIAERMLGSGASVVLWDADAGKLLSIDALCQPKVASNEGTPATS